MARCAGIFLLKALRAFGRIFCLNAGSGHACVRTCGQSTRPRIFGLRHSVVASPTGCTLWEGLPKRARRKGENPPLLREQIWAILTMRRDFKFRGNSALEIEVGAKKTGFEKYGANSVWSTLGCLSRSCGQIIPS